MLNSCLFMRNGETAALLIKCFSLSILSHPSLFIYSCVCQRHTIEARFKLVWIVSAWCYLLSLRKCPLYKKKQHTIVIKWLWANVFALSDRILSFSQAHLLKSCTWSFLLLLGFDFTLYCGYGSSSLKAKCVMQINLWTSPSYCCLLMTDVSQNLIIAWVSC